MHIATKPHMIFSRPGGQVKSIDEDDDLSAEAIDVWVGGWMDGMYVSKICIATP